MIKQEFDRVGIKVDQIRRIENKTMWEKFRYETELLTKHRQPGYQLNERYLFHGTTVPLESLCEEGLDMRLSTTGLFGKGTYFSDDPRKCLKYALGNDDSTSDSLLYILKCRVILGDIKEYDPHKYDHELKREPEKVNPKPGEHKFYDSVKGRPKDYNEYVIYENRRAIIEYIITFHKPGQLGGQTTGFVFSPPKNLKLGATNNSDVSPSLGAMSYNQARTDVAPSLRAMSNDSQYDNVSSSLGAMSHQPVDEPVSSSLRAMSYSKESNTLVNSSSGGEKKQRRRSLEDVVEEQEMNEELAQILASESERPHHELEEMQNKDSTQNKTEDVHPEIQELLRRNTIQPSSGKQDNDEEEESVRPVFKTSRSRSSQPAGQQLNDPPKADPKSDLDDEVRHQLLIQQVRAEIRTKRKQERLDSAIAEASKRSGFEYDPKQDMVSKLTVWEEAFESGSLPRHLYPSFKETYGQKLEELKAQAENEGASPQPEDAVDEEEAINEVLNRVVMEFLEVTQTDNIKVASDYATRGNFDISQALNLYYTATYS